MKLGISFKIQLFEDLLLKASSIMQTDDFSGMTLEVRASSAYCAWQVAICYLDDLERISILSRHFDL